MTARLLAFLVVAALVARRVRHHRDVGAADVEPERLRSD